MNRFRAIEGLRGWLAWGVVFSHLAYEAGVSANFPGSLAGRLGSPAVLVFVIISGFVITHLILEKPEPYGIYLIRRFLRIFPVFAIASAVGYFAYDVQALTLAHVAYARAPGFAMAAQIARIARSDHQFFWAHAFAHLTMLNGVFNNRLLPDAEYAFSLPGWSLSLEWQFYLVAPAVILLIRRNRGLVWLGIGTMALGYACRHGLFGSFEQPSFLPAAAGYFTLGIASRFAYPLIAGRIRYPAAVLAPALVFLPVFARETIPMLIWVVVLAGLAFNPFAPAQTWFDRVYRIVLESRAAAFAGSRSYSVYLCHMPILALCHWALLRVAPLAGPAATFCAVTAMTVPLVVGVAELLYRGVERRGIALGARIASRLTQRTAPAPATAQALRLALRPALRQAGRPVSPAGRGRQNRAIRGRGR